MTEAASAGTDLGLNVVEGTKVFEDTAAIAKAVPIAGNILSGVAALEDFKKMGDYNNDCLVGKN